MNIQEDRNTTGAFQQEQRFLSKLKFAEACRHCGLLSESTFVDNRQHQAELENACGIDVTNSVSRLVKRLNVYLFGVKTDSSVNENNPELESRIADEFSVLANCVYHTINDLVQQGAVRFDRALLKLDLAIDAIDRKIDDYKVRAPELLYTIFLRAELDLRRYSINEFSARDSLERFRHLNRLQHRSPQPVSAFSISLAVALTVIVIVSETAYNSEILQVLFSGNRTEGLLFALAFTVANAIFGGVLVGRFGIRYLIHNDITKKLFPGALCFLLGILCVFAIALYLGLVVMEIKKLPTAPNEVGSSLTALAAQHDGNFRQVLSNAKTTFLDLQFADTFDNHSRTVVIVTLLFAMLAYIASLFVSDLYPGYSAAARIHKTAQYERLANTDKAVKLIANAKRNIVADLQKSMHVTEVLIIEVESEIVSRQELINEAAHVTGVLCEGYQEGLSLCRHGTTVQSAFVLQEPVERTEQFVLGKDRTPQAHVAVHAERRADHSSVVGARHKLATNLLTSVLTNLGTESEVQLRKLDVSSIERITEANNQLHRRVKTSEELDKLVCAIEQCAAEYSSRLVQKQSEYTQQIVNAALEPNAAKAKLNLDLAARESRIFLN